MKQLQRVWADRLLVALRMELLIAHAQAAALADGTDDNRQELHACRHALQHHPLLHRSAVGQHAVHGHRREHPALNAVIVEHLRIRDVVLVRLRLTLYDDTEHVEDGIAMPVERRANQGVAPIHLVFHPFPLEFLQCQSPVFPQRIDKPKIKLIFL